MKTIRAMNRQRLLIGILILGLLLALAVGPGTLSARPRADFDGDGRADLAIGVPGDNPNGVTEAGAVDVVYGSSSGLSTSGVQYWHQSQTGVMDTAEQYDNFGRALAAGDFNGDGRYDLAVGVPGQTVGGDVNAGAVHILYGFAGGLTDVSDEVWHQDVGLVGTGAEPNDYFGWALAAGDFDGDGRDDLAIGVPFETIGAQGSGVVQILYGDPGGLTEIGPLGTAQTWRQGADGLPETEEIGDHFGDTLATGDFNNDGYADLVVGVPEEDFASPIRADVGVVHVLYGSANGLTATGNELWHQDLGMMMDTAEPNDTFGLALTTGDLNGDGYDDLAVGVPGEEVGGDGRAGAVHILFGMSSGLTAFDDQLLDQDDLGTIAEVADRFGWSLAASDFDGDGYDDLAVGVPYEDMGVDNMGSVQVLYGSGDGPSTTNVDRWFQGALGGLSDEPELDDRFGYTLAAGDFDDDGYADLVIGVPYEDVMYQSINRVDAGYVHVLSGSASGLSATGDKWFFQDNVIVLDAPAAGEHFGYALAAVPTVKHKIYLPLILRNYETFPTHSPPSW